MKKALMALFVFSFVVMTSSAAFACGGDKHMSGGDGTTQGEGSGE